MLRPLLMEFPILPIGTVHFRFKGCWVVFFIFIQILTEQSVSEQLRPEQTAHPVVSDLGLHCLVVSHKKDATFIRAEQQARFHRFITHLKLMF